MVVVTDKKIYLDGFLQQKLDLLCQRTMGKKKFDSIIIIDGYEGYGKSTLAMLCAYYCAWYTKRQFDLSRVFFDADDMIEFASNTQDQIIVWDEAAISGLASEWNSKTQRKLIKFVMIARKKRHIIFMNIPKFVKLAEYLADDRSLALIHVYARNETQLGYFAYFMKRKKGYMFNEWRKKKHIYYHKFKSFSGRFANQMYKVINEDEYDRRKDEAIKKALEEHQPKNRLEIKYKKIIARLIDYSVKKYGENIANMARKGKFNKSSYYTFAKLLEEDEE